MDRLDSMDASTGLLGSLPELDSMAVVELLAEIEDRFGFEIDDCRLHGGHVRDARHACRFR